VIDSNQDADAHRGRQQVRTAVTHQRQSEALGRQCADVPPDVAERVQPEQQPDAVCEERREGRLRGLGAAAEAAQGATEARAKRCSAIRQQALAALAVLDIRMHGDPGLCLPHVLNFSVDGVDSEALMLAMKHLVAVSNGSACTSQSYKPSHVLQAMGLPMAAISGAIRMSWCHMTPDVDWMAVVDAIDTLR